MGVGEVASDMTKTNSGYRVSGKVAVLTYLVVLVMGFFGNFNGFVAGIALIYMALWVTAVTTRRA